MLRRCDRKHAFTLPELLVVLGVIAIVIGLSVPSLRRARESGYQTVVLSNLRGVGVAFEMYVQAHDDTHPWAEAMQPLPLLEGHSIATDDPFALSYAWPTLFHRVAPWQEHYAAWITRRAGGGTAWLNDDGSSIRWPDYAYARSFQARPEAWAEQPQGAGPDRWFRPTRASDVAYPSAKVLAFDEHRSHIAPGANDDKRGVLRRDGSGVMRRDEDARAPVQNRITFHEPVIYHDTRAGVHGRDF